MTTQMSEERPLTETAFKLYHEKLDGFGTARSWVISFEDLRRLSNKLAGGPGVYPGAIHCLFRQIICQGVEAMSAVERIAEAVKKDMERVGALESVYLRCVLNEEDPAKVLQRSYRQAEEKIDRREEVSPREDLAYRVLGKGEDLRKVLSDFGVEAEVVENRLAGNMSRLGDDELFAIRVANGENPVDIFNAMGVTKEVVETHFLCQSLTDEQFDFVVHLDIGKEVCPGCDEGKGEFQPVVAKCVRRDLSEVDSSAFSDEWFAGDEYGEWTTGSFVSNRDSSGHFEMFGLHGPALKVGNFSGMNHLFEARKELAEKQGKVKPVLSFGRESARRFTERKNGRTEGYQREKSRIKGLFGSQPSGGLMGGISVSDHQRAPDRHRRDRRRKS